MTKLYYWYGTGDSMLGCRVKRIKDQYDLNLGKMNMDFSIRMDREGLEFIKARIELALNEEGI
jgi:hypothetical protein